MSAPKLIILYDGVCNLCATVVRFVLARDPARAFSFCAIQSRAAAPLLLAARVPPAEALSSFVLLDTATGVALRRSDAALAIGARLSGAWPWLAAAGRWVPRPLRDAVYDCVAARRYAWFGKAGEGAEGGGGAGDSCHAPTRAVLSRFVDAEEVVENLRRRRKGRDTAD